MSAFDQGLALGFERAGEAGKRKQQFADSYRKTRLDQAGKIADTVGKIVSTQKVIDPSSGAERIASPEELRHAQMAHQQVTDYIKNLSNPAFDPYSGQIREHPIHKLLDKLHATKPPAEQMSDISDIQAKYGNPPEENPFAKTARVMKQANLPEEDIKTAQRVQAGAQAKPSTASARPQLKLYKLPDGSESWLDASKTDDLPEGAQPVATTKQANREAFEPDPESPTGFSKVSYDPVTGKEFSRQKNVVPPRGYFGTETKTIDPFGGVTTSSRQPVIPGMGKTPAGNSSGAPKSSTPKPAGQQKKDIGAIHAKHGGAPALDASGYIPSTYPANPRVVEAANQILEGQDVSKIDAKARYQASELAREFGWKGQGLFTPKESLLIREASTFLKQMANDPKELAIYDLPLASKAKLIPLVSNPDKQGLFGNLASLVASGNINQQEADALAAYRQLVGTVSGLSQLTKGGRATEAQIERLKQELPNIMQTKDSTDAKNRLGRLLKEIDVAQDRGTFESASSDSDTVYARDPQGKLHQGKKGTPLPQGWTLEHAPTAQ